MGGTTTLQALVNLKSSSIRLSPLSIESSDGEGTPHSLEFHYDCDSPKCSIMVNVLPPVTSLPTTITPEQPIVVYESTFEGGFARKLSLEDGVTLELSQYIFSPKLAAGDATQESVVRTPVPKKRLTAFAFRRRNQRSDVAGPALRVVDADAIAATGDNEKKDEIAVRLAIRLEALDANGEP